MEFDDFNSKNSLIKSKLALNRPREKDSREGNCDVIYESYRRQEIEGRFRSRIVFLLASVLAISAIISIGLLQYDEYFAYLNDRYEYINQTKMFCKQFEIANIDIISTPISGALVLVYIVLYKRRVFLRNKFRYRNIGVPMMVSLWNKKDRLLSAFTYGLIAFNIFNIVRNSLNNNNTSKKLLTFKDPTGLLPLLIKVMEMFLVGIRYYPVLVAFRANTFLISVSCALYMWVDFVENIYQYGKCESIYTELDPSLKKTEVDRRLVFYMTYKVLSAIPLSIFSAFITVTLTYKATINLIDFIFKYSSIKTRDYLIKQSKDSCGCLICNVDDDHEIFYSRHDLDYVINLLSSKKEIKNLKNKNEIKKNLSKVSNKYLKVEKRNKNKFLSLANKIYEWDSTFRFTSRYMNTIIVGLVALYYFFLFLGYNIIIYVTYYVAFLPDSLEYLDINISDILCSLSDSICIEDLQILGSRRIKMPKNVASFSPELKNSLNAVFIAPIFCSLLVCLIQLFLLIKETKTHLRELYKGKCEFVKKATSLPNASIASSSFHFGGYLVGYLLWGYFIIYIFIVLVGLVIICIRLFVGDKMFGTIALRLVPVFTVMIVKKIVNTIASKYIFLYRESKLLALNNFRAFNVFLYFNFYFDCFMGVISAVIRLIKAVILAVFMMPRLSYSFIGRHFERMDNGYSCYSGFLHMEAMHTNSIIISFCSILYYKDLSEHLRRYRIAKQKMQNELESKEEIFLKINKFKGRLSITSESNYYYTKKFVTRWHLYVMLSKHKELIKYRKHFIIEKEKPEKESLFSKVKNFCKKNCCGKCCCKEK